MSLPTADIPSTTVQFIASFNSIDKYFDTLLQTEFFLPYNEKIKRFLEDEYPVSWFVRIHQHQLKFLGELRNYLAHGMKLDGHNYAAPTQYALETVEKLAQQLKQPPTAKQVFAKKVVTCSGDDSLETVLTLMKKNLVSHIPVYDQGKYQGVLTDHEISSRLLMQFPQKTIKTPLIKEISLNKSPEYVLFLPASTSVYRIDELFYQYKTQKKKLGALFFTEQGTAHEPIVGVVTSSDLILIEQYIIH